MDGEKRKRGDVDGEVDGKRRRVSEDNGVKKEEPGDDEVEEFFAILRRIRVAVEYFKKGNGRGGRRALTAAMESSSRRGPCFERRDFEEVEGVKGPGEEEEGDTGLDLNADPESEPALGRRGNNGVLTEKWTERGRGRPRKDNRGKTEEGPEDNEVEEFSALILRRMRVAVEYFEKGQCSESSTHDREGPVGVVAREDREAPEYFSLEVLPESSGDELGSDQMDEAVSRTEAVSRAEFGQFQRQGLAHWLLR
ncbi:hypothetical protein RHSIM_Rhsim09G0108600 [Rhododendron simsii]|uniref:Uncharacterized protein n=1 Tax=Rhododendron simsii TaxID=118357 RepID=A0A834LEL4_RHOSS|nr:hypothetical protein RHSIM_Rhsim09G0108600 [Rhododendron simsii]